MALSKISTEIVNNSSAIANVSKGAVSNIAPNTVFARDNEKMNALHDAKDPIANIAEGACDLGKEAVNGGAKVLFKSGTNLMEVVRGAFSEDKNGKKSFQKIFLLLFTGVIGLLTLQSGVGLLGNIINSDYRKNHSPSIFLAIKILLGMTLTTGAYRFLINKNNFLNFKSLGLGTAVLGVTYGMTQIFENPNSLVAKLCKICGVDNMIKDLMRMLSLSRDNYNVSMK